MADLYPNVPSPGAAAAQQHTQLGPVVRSFLPGSQGKTAKQPQSSHESCIVHLAKSLSLCQPMHGQSL